MNRVSLQQPPLFTLRIQILFCVLIICNFGFGQSSIHGRVTDKNGQPVPNANVLLLKSSDSSLVLGAVTNSEGEYLMERIKNDTFLLNISITGYDDVFIPRFILSGVGKKEMDMVKLLPSARQLDSVTVVAKKPMFEQKPDRMIINVQSSISNSGSNVVDILERSPGINVNRQGNSIVMNGKSGVMLMINGKIIPASSQEATFLLLEGMNSGNIEKIELITTPPSNLDAEGNAGYINIVLKKSTRNGTNGSYSLTLGYHKGFLEKGSLNFNHRSGSLNVYGDFSLNNPRTEQYVSFYHESVNDLQKVQTNTDLARDVHEPTFDGTLGLDYEMDKKTFLGVMVIGFAHLFSTSSNGYGNYVTNQQVDTILNLYDHEDHNQYQVNANVNITHNYSKDKSISFNANYIHTLDHNPIQYNYSYFDGNNNFLYDKQLRTSKETALNSWIFQGDYMSTFTKTIDLTTGLKATFSEFTNEVIADSLFKNSWVRENAYSGIAHLNEFYPAGYITVKIRTDEKTNLYLGLRYEYTISKLSSDTTEETTDRHYGNLLPTMVFDHKINDNNSFSVAYNRRITRPKIRDLAPFVIYFDPYTFVSGNPNLLPALGDNLDFHYNWKTYLFGISYSYIKNPIADFFPQIDSVTHIETLVARNLDYSKIWNAVFTIPIHVNNWWSMSNSLTATWQRLKTNYNNEPLKLSILSYKIQTTQTFVLPKEFSLELSGFYNSASTNDFLQFYTLAPFGSLDFSVRKTFTQIGSFTFNCEDLLRTTSGRYSINSSSPNLVASIYFQPVFTEFRLTYSHNFGNSKVGGKRDRNTGTEEFMERIK
jgi:hypothetical protein